MVDLTGLTAVRADASRVATALGVRPSAAARLAEGACRATFCASAIATVRTNITALMRFQRAVLEAL